MSQIEDLPKEDEPFGLGCALEFFSEHEEVFSMIDNIVTVSAAPMSAVEKAYERFSFILGRYIEQPHLIDSHIDALLEKLIGIIRNDAHDMAVKHLTFKYMFVIVNVRGYKVIVRHLPHEVSDFEAVLQLLEAQNPSDPETWTTRYILLLWLSIIVMIPFHMSRFDGFVEKESESKTVMTRVLDIIKCYAVVPDKCRDAAAFLSYRFITRNDVKEVHLSSVFDWAIEQSSCEKSNVFVRYGTLACVATILKHGKREDLLPYARKLLEWIINAQFKNNSGSSVQKLCYKIIQRIGLTFVPPRVAAWRYKRGNRSLAENLSAGDAQELKSKELINRDLELEEHIDVPDEVEEVIDQLLQGLRCQDGVVRWSAAKGIGRVTGRLPKELADEVVGSVLELFSPREGDSAWHGGCIALAELGRRGLLLPDRLPQVVPLVLKALVYDEPRGYSSVGSHIRDAACYVCWSFARAYETHILAPYVNEIAGTLLVVTCFDKEINCRRAASAAFQENVGRQGTFPHGIDILTTADFFAVSVRNNAYLTISVFIAQFEEYTHQLIDHLVARKVDHWDLAIRELAAKALHNLTPLAPQYMVDKVLPQLFTKTESIDLNCRHGAVLAVGEIIYSLSKIDPSKDIQTIIGSNLLETTKNLIPSFNEKLYFRGLGGELMKQASSDFIEKCSLAALPYHDDPVIEQWLKLLNDCILYKVTNIRTAAITALPVFLNQYFNSAPKAQRYLEIIKFYTNHLESITEEENRMGTALALGALPKFMLIPHLDFIIRHLTDSALITAHTVKWSESRRDAVKALTAICTTLADDLGGDDFTDGHVLKIYQTFFEGLRDYTQDKRGDIGAWMREASMTGIQTLTLILANSRPGLLTENLGKKIVSGIAQQAVEKIDRTRALAGKVFYSIIYHDPAVPNVPYFEEIRQIFPKDQCDLLNWNSAAATFPKFVKLIKFPCYTYPVMLGLICSVGGMTETLVKHSSAAIFNYLKEQEAISGSDEAKRLCEVVYQIFEENQKLDRITVPVFRFIDKLFDSGCVSFLTEEETDYPKKLLKLVQLEIAGCRDIYKLIDGINVLCQFIQIKGDVGNTALVQLSILLCHRQSYVRRSTSSKFYESLLVNGESSNVIPDNLDEVMQILSSVNWEDPVEQIKPVRNELCALMGVRVPVSK